MVWLGSVTVALVLAGGTAAGDESAADADARARVHAALTAAVRQRMAADATVDAQPLVVRWADAPPTGDVTVVPEPGQRVGGAMRFMVFSGSRGGGRAAGVGQAHVRVIQMVVRARVPIARGARIVAADVEEARADVGRRPFDPLPTLGEVVGSLARRPFAVGDVVGALAIRRLPLVKSGDELVIRARLGQVEAVGRAVASEVGDLGDVIRVVNADSGRVLKAEIVGPGEVEVRHVR